MSAREFCETAVFRGRKMGFLLETPSFVILIHSALYQVSDLRRSHAFFTWERYSPYVDGLAIKELKLHPVSTDTGKCGWRMESQEAQERGAAATLHKGKPS